MKENRALCLLQYLLEQNDYISTGKIASHLNISARTVYNDINSAGFKKLLYGAYVEKKTNNGIKLIANELQLKKISRTMDQYKFQSDSYLSDNDTNNILFLLFSSPNPITVDLVSKHLYKSRTNLSIELDKVSKWFLPYGIILEKKKNNGLVLAGQEEEIRNAFKDLCFNFETTSTSSTFPRLGAGLEAILGKIFSLEALKEVVNIVNMSEVNLNGSYTDHDYENLVVKLCVLIFRNRIEKTIISQHHFTNEIREFLAAQLIKVQIDYCFHLNLMEDEISEITYYILSARRQEYISNLQESIIKKVIDKFTSLLSVSLNIDLNYDEELKKSLFNHLTPAIRRMRYGIKIENPLLTQIKYEYTNVYIAVMTSIEEIEKKEKVYFDANELGYICLHIVAAINRSNKKRYISTCLICEGGITISTFLKSKIERQFSEIVITEIVSLTNYNDMYLEDFSLFLNATRTPAGLTENAITITLMLDDNDQDAIRSWIIKKEYQKLIDNNHQIKNNILFFKDSIENKNDLIKKYCRLLEIDENVTADYLGSVLEREKRASTSLGRGIAVPHGSGSFVKDSAILVIRLDKPIPWDEQLVDLVFLIAINFSESNTYYYFFEKLFKIVSNDSLIKKLKQASNTAEMENILFKEPEGSESKK